eukprot:scaffold1289_cov274-Pinguiococcus_pyrenoidosus.AAC.17
MLCAQQPMELRGRCSSKDECPSVHPDQKQAEQSKAKQSRERGHLARLVRQPCPSTIPIGDLTFGERIDSFRATSCGVAASDPPACRGHRRMSNVG